MSSAPEVSQMRPTDRIAVLGVMLGALGAAIFLAGSSSIPVWMKFLVGPMLWYFGLALLLAWALVRALPVLIHPVLEDREPAVEAKPHPAVVQASNFLEHDYTNIA